MYVCVSGEREARREMRKKGDRKIPIINVFLLQVLF